MVKIFHEYKIVLLYLILFTGKQYAASRTGYDYVAEVDVWLRLHIMPATWPDARLRCHLEGGVLASPTTSAMATAMAATMAAHKLSMRSVFIGVHAFISKGDFMSMDGAPLSDLSLRWREGEPNNVNNVEDCIVMTGTGELVDMGCTIPHAYICRKETSKMTLNNCGTTADGYKIDSRTASCYKFHKVPRTWHRAAMACHAEGGHLAVINSEVEYQVLKDIFGKVPTASIKGANPNMALVGFWDWKEHGEWLTIFGQTLSEAGYEGWGPGEPNNVGGEEYCGSIKRDGRLNDIACNDRQPFICEITPK